MLYWLLQKFHNVAIFELLAPKGPTVVMVTFCVAKMAKTWSPMIEQFFDTMIEHPVIKSGYMQPTTI